MRSFRLLSLASTGTTLVLVTIGGLVRATRSGLGCGTDWPHCSGKLVPALQSRAVIIEYSHRVTASLVVVLLGTLALLAWRRLRSYKHLVWGSTIAFGLVLFQAVLGAVVVKLELEAESVVLHLATAMSLLAVLVYVVAGAYGADDKLPAPPTDRSVTRRAAGAAGAVLALLMVGSYVSGTPGAGLAFGDWPLMNGHIVPDLSAAPAALHFLHRVLAAGVGIVVAVVALRIIRSKDVMPLQARFAHAALGSFSIEILLGAANVWTGLNPVVVTAHLFVGTVVWVSLVAISVTSRPTVVASTVERHPGPSRPALDAVR
jgi:heme A synthase